eukprot:762924-Hanusia_phi.AAC.8
MGGWDKVLPSGPQSDRGRVPDGGGVGIIDCPLFTTPSYEPTTTYHPQRMHYPLHPYLFQCLNPPHPLPFPASLTSLPPHHPGDLTCYPLT